jgi:microcystin-dependent protein
MTVTIDYQPLANGGAALVESQAQYLIDLGAGGSLENGYQNGVANPEQVNKTLRQTSMISAAVANYIGNTLGVNVLDDGNLPALITLLTSAIAAASWTTGDVKLTMKVVADAGWVLMNDGSIGSAASGATTRANADTLALYTLLWTNVAQAWAVVATGRGASAAADFAANKPMLLTKTLGRALAIAGAGGGLTARALGENLGAETVVLDTTMIPAHLHAFVTGVNSADHFHNANGATDAVANHNHGVNDPTHAHTSYSHDSDGVTVGDKTQVSHSPHEPPSGSELTSYSATGITLDAAGGHNHGVNFNTGGASATHTHAGNTNNTGGGLGHPNMQPTAFLNAMIKL